MINALISALLQVAAVLAIAAVVWLVIRRPERFRRFVGMTSAPWRVVAIAFIAGALVAILITNFPGVHNLASGEGTVVGEATRDGFTTDVAVVLALRALIQTSLSEELLFRGLLGRNLIRRWGFAAGNSVQAVVFGLFHLLLLLTPNATFAAVLLIVVLTGLVGWLLGWMNERLANGSILPSWAAHGGGNLTAYLLLTSAA